MTDRPFPLRSPAAAAAIAAAAAVVHTSGARFTVLSPWLLRLESSPAGQFEDRPSQVIWQRSLPVPEFTVDHQHDTLTIETPHLKLTYQTRTRAFTRRALSIEVKATGAIWRYGDRGERDNLRGTARTLDGVDGAIPLEPGLMSRAGWAVVDDSRSLVFDARGWLTPRDRPGNLDLYFFGHGHNYRQALRDFGAVAGRVPLIPRWALGNWWSRYWAYTQDELTQLMRDFQAHDIPLSVCIMDMDWHITDTGNTSSGWTGYTWNRALFPEPEKFIAWLHAQGLKTALNLHPADGVHPHEAQYAAMAQALGRDAQSGEPIPFEVADPEFMRAYFDILHHPLEAMGVDFWWLDWQQGTHSGLPGLDPLMWLNHLHFADLGRDGVKRPFIFSRWPGLGGHRYPIGFSGDTVVSWASLAFQPYFTATASNVGFGWWSHDIGGHMFGVEDPELFVRWTQLGAFSPILRLHSTNNPYQDRRPWAHDAETLRLLRNALQLRHALIPYLYSMAYRQHVSDQPLIAPLYYDYPEDADAYRCPQQYLFGTELLAAPFVSPRDVSTRLSRQTVWLPPGRWFNFFSGEAFDGARWLDVYGTLDETPVFARAGAIVPLARPAPHDLEIHVFPEAANHFELYDDDGETTAYRRGHSARLPIDVRWQPDRLSITIGAVAGDRSLMPASRAVRVVVHAVAMPGQIEAAMNGAAMRPAAAFEAGALTLGPLTMTPADEWQITLQTAGTLAAAKDNRAETCRRYLRLFRLESDRKAAIDRDLDLILADPARLGSYGLTDAQLAALRSAVGRQLNVGQK